MKKIISTVLTILVLTVSFTGRANAVKKEIPTKVYAMNSVSDNRVIALKNYLENYGSPLAPYAQSYVNAADKYGMDWKLLPAIAGLESSFGIHQLRGSYNSYGWGGGRIYFDSVEDGIDTVMYALRNKYMSRGATTVETIGPIYSESPTWAIRVNKFMSLIDAEYQRVGMRNLTLTI